jgi:4-diphosphocytidyl-2-C-methyl-D-erythritol kinase
MFAFNAFAGHVASSEQLEAWAGEIGSDVSFFFSAGTAYCTGRGELVSRRSPLPDADKVSVHVFKPQEGLSTAAVFKALDLSTLSKSNPLELLYRFEAYGLEDKEMLLNDLETPAFALCPQLLRIKQRLLLLPGVRGAVMSGSGTSVYAITDREAVLPVEEILSEFAGLCHFQCGFLNRPANGVNPTQWYE